jgi:hypothetical protein
MAENLRSPKKKFQKKPRNPIEVIIWDVCLKEYLIAEYHHESKIAFSGRIFKVYHPVWSDTGGARWVHEFYKKLGTFIPDAPVSE